MATDDLCIIQSLIAQRLGGDRFGKEERVYKFERIKRAKRAAMAERPDVPVIDFGVGEPDGMAHPMVVEALAREAADPANRSYTDNGAQELKDAIVRYMASAYGVHDLDASQDVVHTVGAKNALSFLPSAFIDPGDVCLQPAPGYPVMATHTRWYGGEVHTMPLTRARGFLPDLDAVPADVAARAKLLYLNYPNNPTGAVADAGFFREAVAIAREHGVLIISDLAYGPLVYGDRAPLSILSIEGAREVALEIHSFSKAFNMTGWRLSWAVGNRLAVHALANVKDNYDSGQFRAIQRAGVVALDAHRPITGAITAHYERRLELLVAALNRLGFDARMPGGSFYLYVKAPRGARGVDFADAEAATEHLIREASIVTVPWDEAGAYLRFSATFESEGAAHDEAVISEAERRLRGLALRF
jgi:LL-diaminopimelate aminotransferase